MNDLHAYGQSNGYIVVAIVKGINSTAMKMWPRVLSYKVYNSNKKKKKRKTQSKFTIFFIKCLCRLVILFMQAVYI